MGNVVIAFETLGNSGVRCQSSPPTMVAFVYNNSLNALFETIVEMFKKSLHGTYNILQLHQ